jgi:ribulose-phosphate 3-epimerase
MKAYVSLWSADLLNVGADIDRVGEVADGFHIDITDGQLTPQLLFGPDFVAAVRARTGRLIDVHLMVRDADVWVPRFIDVGADMVTVHRRSTPDLAATLASIRSAGAAPSLAVEVPEPVPEAAAAEWADIDRLLLMGTEIGIKGVDVDPDVYDRVRRAVLVRDALPHRPEVFVDGGIRERTAPLMASAGADGVIPGSLVYAVADPPARVAWLHALPGHALPSRATGSGRIS